MATDFNGITSYGISLKMDNQELANLLEIPELGGEVEAIEITTLADEAHRYTDGLKNYGDSLAFKFLFEPEQFRDLNDAVGTSHTWTVTLPDSEYNSGCMFNGTHSVKLDGVGTNAALTYTLSIKPNSAMVWQIGA